MARAVTIPFPFHPSDNAFDVFSSDRTSQVVAIGLAHQPVADRLDEKRVAGRGLPNDLDGRILYLKHTLNGSANELLRLPGIQRPNLEPSC